jgi:DnaK suppressor protein
MTADLTQDQIKELEQRLRERYAQIQDEVRTALEETGNQEYQEIIGRVRDPGEESLAMLIADLNLTRINQLSDEARAIERALSEIDSGGYGICAVCDQPIGYPRLKAQPTAVLCIEDQRKREQEFGAGRPSSL